MLTKRIIPCLDVKDGRVVKGVQFVDLTDAGDPVEVAAAYDAQGADELCFLDINASHEQRGTMIELVARTADRLTMPFSVGGGVRSLDDVRALLRAGADKVSVNSAAIGRPELVAETADRLGSANLIVAIDARRRDAADARARLGGLHPRRSAPDRARRRRVGGAHRGARRRRDPAHQHGSRRHARRLRPRAHARSDSRGADSRDRLGRRGHARAPARGARRLAAGRRRVGGAGREHLPLRHLSRARGQGVPGRARSYWSGRSGAN